MGETERYQPEVEEAEVPVAEEEASDRPEDIEASETEAEVTPEQMERRRERMAELRRKESDRLDTFFDRIRHSAARRVMPAVVAFSTFLAAFSVERAAHGEEAQVAPPQDQITFAQLAGESESGRGSGIQQLERLAERGEQFLDSLEADAPEGGRFEQVYRLRQAVDTERPAGGEIRTVAPDAAPETSLGSLAELADDPNDNERPVPIVVTTAFGVETVRQHDGPPAELEAQGSLERHARSDLRIHQLNGETVDAGTIQHFESNGSGATRDLALAAALRDASSRFGPDVNRLSDQVTVESTAVQAEIGAASDGGVAGGSRERTVDVRIDVLSAESILTFVINSVEQQPDGTWRAQISGSGAEVELE